MRIDVPQVALDMQHIFKAPYRVKSELGKQMQFVISDIDSFSLVVTEEGIVKSFPDTKDIVYISRLFYRILKFTSTLLFYNTSNLGFKLIPKLLYLYNNYVWQSGPMYLPFPNLMRILREVYISGGDWETALLFCFSIFIYLLTKNL
uniref:Conserved domain protein n=1 Tax=Heterorhabditis bacteriophora TaxID=37862 RepID=A0A1I7WL34_HETBA